MAGSKENTLTIYTDGSSSPRPRKGGIGYRFITINEAGDEVIEDCAPPGYKGATNNQMELQACIEALREAIKRNLIEPVNSVIVCTDSQYVSNNYRSAMFEWPKSQWMLRSDAPVLNADLWKELVKLIGKCGQQRRKVTIEWVRGHSRDKNNKAVDALAKKSAMGFLKPPLSIVASRRKTTDASVERGCVDMHGQTFAIRVVTAEYLPIQRMHKYKYEVISAEDEHFGKVDIIFSKESLRAARHYLVTVNDNSANPTITNVVQELDRGTPKK